MSNELTVYEAQTFSALDPESDAREALEANLQAGETIEEQDLIRVSVPTGGATTWQINGPSGVETCEEIVGVLCYVAPRGILWPSTEPTENALPVLISHDLKTATQVGPIPEWMAETLEKYRINEREFDWENLPYNQFGSGKGASKLCKEQRMLFILRQNDLWPLAVVCPPGSLKDVRKFVKMLSVPYFRAVVSLRLVADRNQAGQAYSRIVPQLVGTLSREDGKIVKQNYSEALREVSQKISVVQVDPENSGAPADGEENPF